MDKVICNLNFDLFSKKYFLGHTYETVTFIYSMIRHMCHSVWTVPWHNNIHVYLPRVFMFT